MSTPAAVPAVPSFSELIDRMDWLEDVADIFAEVMIVEPSPVQYEIVEGRLSGHGKYSQRYYRVCRVGVLGLAGHVGIFASRKAAVARLKEVAA